MGGREWESHMRGALEVVVVQGDWLKDAKENVRPCWEDGGHLGDLRGFAGAVGDG